MMLYDRLIYIAIAYEYQVIFKSYLAQYNISVHTCVYTVVVYSIAIYPSVHVSYTY